MIIFISSPYIPECWTIIVCLNQFETPPTGFWQNLENCQILEKKKIQILGTTKQNS